MHFLRESRHLDRYYRSLRLLQSKKTSELIDESTWQFIKLGELRRALKDFFVKPLATVHINGLNPDVPVNAKTAAEAVENLLQLCSSRTGCKPIVVTIPSNEPGESKMLRRKISLAHGQMLAAMRNLYPEVNLIDLGKDQAPARCQDFLFDSPGRHLSPKGQACLNARVSSVVLSN